MKLNLYNILKNRFFKIIIAFVLLLVSNIKGESQTFTISTTVRNGTITADTTVSTGTNGRITYLANSGYYLDSIFIKNVYDSAISIDSTNGFTFNNISANDTIKVVFSPYFNISTSTNGNGTISSSVNNIKRGGYSNITYQPSSGYRLDSVLINNINRGKDSMTSYTFYNIQANNVIRAYFSMIPPDTLTVNIITEMTSTQNFVIPYGADYRYTYQTPSGYKLDSIIVNNMNKGTDSSIGYTFYNVTSNINFNLYYSVAQASDTLTVQIIADMTSGENYVIPYGSNYRYTYQTPNGYKLDSIIVNNMNKGTDSSIGYTFYNVTSNINFKLYYSVAQASDTLTVQIIADMTSGENYVIPYGTNYRYTYQTPNGYKLDSIIVNNMNKGTDSSIGYTFYNVTSNINFKLYYSVAQASDTLTVQIIADMTSGENYVIPYGSNYRYMYQTPNGYKLDSVIVNNMNKGTDSSIGYTFYNVTSNINFKLYYSVAQASDTLTVQIIADMTSGENYVIPYGTNYRYTYQTPNGYKLDSIIVNNINKGTDSSRGYTFYNVTSNINFKLYYSVAQASDTLTVQIIAEMTSGQNYVIPYGTNYRYTYQTPSGYKLDSVIVNNINKGTDSSRGYTFYNVTSNINFKLYYSIAQASDTLTVQIIAEMTSGENYVIPYNTNYRYTYQTPNGYKLDSVIVNNMNKGNDSSLGYTFYNVTSNINFKLYYSVASAADTITIEIVSEMSSTVNYVIPYGSNYRYTYQTPAGYQLDSILVNNVNVGKDSSMGYTFYNVRSNINFKLYYSANDTVYFEIVTETTTTIQYVIPYGSNYRITYQTPAGYKLDSIILNGQSVSKDSTTGYTINNITMNQTFRLYYSLIVRSINVSLSYSNPVCNGNSGLINMVNNNNNQPLLLRVTIPTRGDTTLNYSGQNLTYAGLAGTYQLCFADKTDTNVKRCYTVKITQPIALQNYSIGIDNKSLVINNTETPILVKVNNQSWVTYDRNNIALQNGVNTIVIKNSEACPDSIVKQVVLFEDLQVYPNPAKDYVTIYVNAEVEQVNVKLVNEFGKMVEWQNVKVNQDQTIRLDLSNMSSGNYIIKIESKNYNAQNKLLILK